jgi:hypothetical protein
MGVDYRAVAGFSVPLTDEVREQITKLAKEKAGDEYENRETDFDILGVSYCSVGSNYTTMDYIPIFTPETAVNLDEHLLTWLSDFNSKCKTSFAVKDVIFVEELFIS